MRTSFQFVGCAIAFCNVIGFAAAEESDNVPRSIYPVNALTCPNSLLRACCDIYCPKPLPCIKPFCRGCRKDDYCSKPCPRIECYCRTCSSNCYCGKPCPDLCRPIAADYFVCVKRCSGCALSDNSSPILEVPATSAPFGDDTRARIDEFPAPPLLDPSN